MARELSREPLHKAFDNWVASALYGVNSSTLRLKPTEPKRARINEEQDEEKEGASKGTRSTTHTTVSSREEVEDKDGHRGNDEESATGDEEDVEEDRPMALRFSARLRKSSETNESRAITAPLKPCPPADALCFGGKHTNSAAQPKPPAPAPLAAAPARAAGVRRTWK